MILVACILSGACSVVKKGSTPTGPSTTAPATPSGSNNPPTTPTNPTQSGDTAEQALASCKVSNSPVDVASWPITTQITSLVMRPSANANAGLEFFFSKRGHVLGHWPDWTPPGWAGPIQYTVWAGVKISGQWYCSGIIEMWWDRVATGAPILTDFARNWVYDSRWGGMTKYQPKAGEQMFFVVTAGDARGFTGVTSVRERSQAVFVNVPVGDTGTFTFTTSLTGVDISGFTEPVYDQGNNLFMLEQERLHRDDRNEL